MHMVIWKFEIMEGKSRTDLTDAAQGDSRDYEGVPGLVRLYYGIAPDLRSVIEVYLWQSRAAAERFFNSDWDGETSRRWESPRMTRQDFEVPSVVEAGRATAN